MRVSPFLREDRPLLWLEEKDAEDPLLLPIAIGEFEAAAIQMPLEGELPLRPISYDLLRTMLERVGAGVSRVLIENVEGSVFFAKVVVREGKRERSIDSRPSDAVALALRTGAPIYVKRTLLQEVGLKAAGPEGDVERFVDQFSRIEPQITEQDTVQGEAPQPEPAVHTQPPAEPAEEESPSEIEKLQARLEQAVICEEYEEAARLRDQIRSVQETRTG